MDTIQQSRDLAEMKGTVDCGNGIPGRDRFSYGPQEPKLMDNLYSILTLSLIFYERITKSLDSQSEDGILSVVPEPGIGS